MNEEESWTEVKPREKKISPSSSTPVSPTSGRERVASFGEIDLTAEKVRKSKFAMKEQKLEWSATKRRERELRVNVRQEQRERTAKEQASREEKE